MMQRFTGPNSHDVLRQVRAALGDDAMILGNRMVEGGIEIIAMGGHQVAALTGEAPALVPRPAAVAAVATVAAEPQAPAVQAPTVEAAPSIPEQAARSRSPLAVLRARFLPSRSSTVEAPTETATKAVTETNTSAEATTVAPATESLLKVFADAANRFEAKTAEVAPVVERADEPVVAEATLAMPQTVTPQQEEESITVTAAETRMMAEMRSLRAVLHDQATGLASLGIKLRDPVRSRMFQTMVNAGFSAQLTRYLMENLPSTDRMEVAQEFVQRAIERNLTAVDDDNSLLDQGGIFALMGPTGVGKTTTTAKLAARFVLRHGASRVALLTTDSYRIGGHEQLRIYGKILGVSVHAVRDGEDLSLALADLRDKHVVLIDTIGMSQRDRAVSEQIAMLHSAGTAIKRLLLLNTTSNGKTLDEVVHAYRDANLAGCILTKIDEAATLGHALDVLIRHKLPLQYVSCGQRVPEDIAVANRKMLVHRAFRDGLTASAFTMEEDESYLYAHGAGAGMPETRLAMQL